MKWYYYLHVDGSLIGKNPAVVDSDPHYFDSDLVKKVWCVENREDAWRLVLEALAAGVDIERAKELAERWKLTFEDCREMLKRVNATYEMRQGMEKFIAFILNMDIEEFWLKMEHAWGSDQKIKASPCSWIFKGPECQYAGAEDWCDKSYERCVALNNIHRFPGGPGKELKG